MKHLILLILAALLPIPRMELGAAEARRPNILFILADDQSPFDLTVYNPESQLNTPNIDRLAAEGMVFDGAYHMGSFIGAVCTPSRHMIMSGRTVWHLPNAPLAVHKGLCPPGLEQNTIPAVFNRAGYATMRTCKRGNSYEAANRLFTVRHDATKRGGTHETGSGWHGDRVMDYLRERQARKETKPFLIYYGFSHPHDERDGTPELLAKYGAVNHTDKNNPPPANPRQPELPPNYLPGHPFHHGQPGLRDEIAVSGVWERRDERTIRNETGRQFACSENIDVQIGRVLEQLEAMGELDNTYIVYTADHGMAIGRHGLQGKQNLYQHTWRVPFIVKGPGVKPGSRVEGNIYLLDVLATLCDVAGIDAPETNEGLSFRPVLEGRQTTVRDVLYGVYSGGTKPGMRSVKRGDWKLIKYDVMDGAVRETQLFNLAENPNEFLKEHHDPKVIALTGAAPAKRQVNLADDPRYAGKLKEMEDLLLAEMRRLHDPWRLWNQPDDELTPPPASRRSDASGEPPYPPSPVIAGLRLDWSTHRRHAPGSDNWPMTWAGDGHQYAAWGDGGGFGGTNSDGRVSLGIARIEGDWDNFRGRNVWGGRNSEVPATFVGKSYGILSVDGILYLWCSADPLPHLSETRIVWSEDRGRSWQRADWAFTFADGLTIPTFLNFGREYAGARDDYVYSYYIRPRYGPGRSNSPLAYESGFDVHRPGTISLSRVPKRRILDRDRYEFFAGLDEHGQPRWTAEPAARQPVFADPQGVGWNVSVSHNQGLGRYLLCTEHGRTHLGKLGIFDAPEPWGPWTTVAYEEAWGAGHVPVNTFYWSFPTKWMSVDGRDVTLQFTGRTENDSYNTVRGRFDRHLEK